jgi:acyl-CoA reductase-like NAD-dependent aldehyde dehydrogenase
MRFRAKAVLWRLAGILHTAGVPRGVFNMLHSDGLTVGEAIARRRWARSPTRTSSRR